jgi:DNA polymerase III epsilon subunit-like protein
MSQALIIDTETSNTDAATGHVVEVACILFDLTRVSVRSSYSTLLRAPSNEAFSINGIAPELLVDATEPATAWKAVAALASKADVILAHSAQFDRQWVPAGVVGDKPWSCTQQDWDWPKSSSNSKLSEICIAHKVPIVEAHRALTDCTMIRMLLERCADLGHNLDEMLAAAMVPKPRYVADVPRTMNDTLKQYRFAFDWDRKQWWRKMLPEQAAALPFEVRECA